MYFHFTDDFTDEEEDWEDLFHYINRKDTTPFLGAGIAREHFGSGGELAEKIAKEFEYPSRIFSIFPKLRNLQQ